MKTAKICSAFVALLAMGLIACGGKAAGDASSGGNNKPSSSSSSQKKSSSSIETGPDYTQIIARTWDAGTPANNSDSKEYLTLTDATANKVGVKISIQNYTVDADAAEGTTLGNDGKIGPGNNHDAYLTYKITAPKAGAYQMIMRGKSKDDALEKTLDERSFDVKLNGVSQDVASSRVVFTTTDQTDFVAVPTINLTGQEDTIKVRSPDFRIQFDTASFIIFSEH